MRGEDKELFGRTRRALALLADEPYPAGAVAGGATGIYGLHAMPRRQRFTSSTSGLSDPPVTWPRQSALGRY